MKQIKICILILCSNMIFAQQNYFDNYQIRCIGSSDEDNGTYYLSGGTTPYMIFNYVDMKKEPGPDLPSYQELDYEKILNGGLNSFLFENKYYGDLSYYSLFGWGNFSVMGNEVLKLANEVFFPNRKLLNSVYAYYVPEYKKAFTKLTVPEQSLYLSKLDMAEKFVKFVLQEKNREMYETWLKKNNLKHDHYITEFMERRVKKGQWKVADCNYWIKKVRKDFEPLKKNPNIKAYYFYEQMNLGDSLLLLIDHECNQFFSDMAYNRCDEKNYQVVKFEDGSFKGSLIGSSVKVKIYPLFNEANEKQYIQLSDSICFFQKDEICKYLNNNEIWGEETKMFKSGVLYDFKNRTIIRDSLEMLDLGYFENIPILSFYSLERDSLKFFRKSNMQMMFGQFYLDYSNMPDIMYDFDPETFQEKRLYFIEPLYQLGKVAAYYYQINNRTILLDFNKGIKSAFEGRGTVVMNDLDYEFVKQ
jgi:hypothetical protein